MTIHLVGGESHPGFGIESIDFILSFDATKLEYPADSIVPANSARPGALLASGNPVLLVTPSGQTLDGGVAVVNVVPLGSGGPIVELDFKVKGDAGEGVTRVDIQQLDLNEGALLLNRAGNDGTDQVVNIKGTAGTPKQVPAVPTSGLLLLTIILIWQSMRVNRGRARPGAGAKRKT